VLHLVLDANALGTAPALSRSAPPGPTARLSRKLNRFCNGQKFRYVLVPIVDPRDRFSLDGT
jgi:hypothetical protein